MSIKKSPLLPEYIDELKKVWGEDQDMIDYEVRSAQSIIKLSTGALFVTNKSRIETEFCFGYSDIGQGPSFDECNDIMDEFRRNADKHFVEKNLAPFDSYIYQLDTDNVRQPFLTSKYYPEKGANIAIVTWMSDLDFIYHPLEQYTPLSDIDKQAIKAVYLADRAVMEKRCQTYLKKYGTKKLHIWRYWIDE